MVLIESTQNQSIREEVGSRNRRIMKSMQIGPAQQPEQHFFQHIYSQPDEEVHTQYEEDSPPHQGYRNRDTFGLHRRRMKES